MDELENWLEPVPPSPNRLDDALELLKSSIEQGAILVGIGPYTNFALLDQKYPGILQQAHIYLMGGWIYPPKKGYPQWESPRDYNIQQDIASAKYVLEHAHPTLIPISITVETAIRKAYLPRLQQAGALNVLIAHQAEVYANYRKNEGETDEKYEALSADLLNFQHDPLACAVALGWSGVKKALVPLTFEVQDGWLYERVDAGGRPTTVVVEVDGPAFNMLWLETVTG
ncbi:MAG: nucleoside hydrolase, partial [Chloroflexota bacterium]|nr:nucleoside hydrolase [Chloroflexota bacterium]